VTAIVTGGAGFIGSHVVDALVERGDRVVVIDDLSTGRRENVAAAAEAGAILHEIDIRDADAVSDVIVREGPDAVFHLAAQIDVRLAVRDPGFDAAINVGGTINVLEAARKAGVRRFVNTSTGGALYGEAQRIPSPEDEPVAPMAPYGQSKLAAEGYCDLYARLHGMSTISLRYGNVYGPRQDPLGEAGVIAIFCGKLRQGERPTVYGDGTQTRDYVHVADAVGANLAAAESDERGAFNIGRGEETSVLDLVEALRDLSGGGDSFDPEFAPPRAGEAQRSALDCARARERLGWEARIDLPDGLRRTLESVDR
jgi:UDP-glucose 4-epimerase